MQNKRKNNYSTIRSLSAFAGDISIKWVVVFKSRTRGIK